MREIKFRAWNELTKEMRYPDTHCNAPKYFFATSENINNNPTPMQYTGLKDKNAKEIYEGDVVKFEMTRKVLVDHPFMTATTDETAIYQGAVMWGEFGWRPFTDGANKEKLEVIGNIYENPELLNL